MTCEPKNKCLGLFVMQQKVTNAKYVTHSSRLMLFTVSKTTPLPNTWTLPHSLDLCLRMSLWVKDGLKRAGYGKKDRQEAGTMVQASVEEAPMREGLVSMH